jgi:uncharacterized membrane protein YgdD (TMEM256/DUF423 family)
MHARQTLFAAAIAMAIAVGLGAFGAHALKTQLAADALAVWQTAVQYNVWHALGLFGVGLWQQHAPQTRELRLAAWLLLGGIVLFSGSLYALALTGMGGLGVITPFGGLAFIAGWAVLAKAALGLNGRQG